MHHVGVDIPTEIGFHYHKREEVNDEKLKVDAGSTEEKRYDGMPHLKTVIWEGATGELIEESYRVNEAASPMFKRKPKKDLMNVKSRFPHGGDGSIPYISLAWAHTWLLHTARAYRRKSSSGERTLSIWPSRPSHCLQTRSSTGWITGAVTTFVRNRLNGHRLMPRFLQRV